MGWRTARSGCLVPAAPSAQVPQGRPESSPALQRWGKRPLGIESRRDDRATQLRRRRFCRPSGTRSAFLLYPALKRWATFESSLAGLPKAIPELSNWGSPPAKPGDFHSIKDTFSNEVYGLIFIVPSVLVAIVVIYLLLRRTGKARRS